MPNPSPSTVPTHGGQLMVVRLVVVRLVVVRELCGPVWATHGSGPGGLSWLVRFLNSSGNSGGSIRRRSIVASRTPPTSHSRSPRALAPCWPRSPSAAGVGCNSPGRHSVTGGPRQAREASDCKQPSRRTVPRLHVAGCLVVAQARGVRPLRFVYIGAWVYRPHLSATVISVRLSEGQRYSSRI